MGKCFQCATSFLNFEHYVFSATVLKNEHKVEQLLSAVLTLIVEKFKGNDYIFDMAKHVLQFIAILTNDFDNEVQGLFWGSLLHLLCRLPPYFMKQKKGRNLLFPAIIGVTFGNEINLKVLDSLMERAVIVQWLEGLCRLSVKQRKKCPVLLPSSMWRECLQFYTE